MDEPSPSDPFQTTHWNLVVSSRQSDAELRQQSLSELCRDYWYPLFIYLRRKGYTPDQAADYVQGFFLQLIDKSFLDAVEPEKGRFRWFLKSAIQRYIANEVKRQTAQKRGGGWVGWSLDVEDAERRYQLEPDEGWTAEKLYDRRWAVSILGQALERLEAQQREKHRLDLYRDLQATLSGMPMTGQQYQEVADKHGMTTGAVKVAALRLRERYRQFLIELVRQTVTDPDIVDNELNELLSALRG